MYGLGLEVFRKNKYVKYGTISACAVLGIVGISYYCCSKVKNDMLKKLKSLKFDKSKETKELKNDEQNKDNKENN
jgi:hypothetical protein